MDVGDTGERRHGIAGNLGRLPDRTSAVWRASDEALLAGLAAGDPEAAVAFVRRYQRRVFGLALTLLGDRDRADDVAQEAMVRAWRHAGAYDARRGSVTTWLLTITRNVAVDTLRASRTTPVEDDRLDALLPASRDVAAASAVAADELRRVTIALEALPAEQRRALLLMRLRGFTAADIAEHDGIPLGTAKTRVRTAMLRLREALVDEPTPRDASS